MASRPTCAIFFKCLESLLAQRWLRFCIVGGMATLAYFMLGLLFVKLLHLPLLFGNALAFGLAFIVSYLGQSLFTFETSAGHAQMLPRYAATQAFGLLLNSAIVWFIVRLGAAYELAMLVATLLVPIVVYMICKYWVFRKRETSIEAK